jgi:riboflavin biosynthesis pyrimidine reductase
MKPITTLIEHDTEQPLQLLPARLRELYGGDLYFPPRHDARPYVIANFVSTLDGVASYKIKGQSAGSPISASDPGDRFIMGLLRASVDAIVVGTQTIHDVDAKDLWTPAYTCPEAGQLYSNYRLNVLHKPEYPLVVIISGSGKLDLERAVFQTPAVPALIVTTSAGRDQLARAGAARSGSLEVRTVEDLDGTIAPQNILQLMSSEFGVRLLLHEGGPTLFGTFLAAELIDEMFLTLAPQIAGRLPHSIRPSMADGVEFLPSTAPWFQILSIKQQAEHLYLRNRARRVAE